MKTAFFALSLFILSTASSFANDGGVAYIDVKSINPAGLQNTKGVQIVGGDAIKLFDLLPPINSVSPELKANQRTLALVSNGWNLFISCSRDAGKPVSCAINALKVEDPNYKYDMLGDAFAYSKDQVCK